MNRLEITNTGKLNYHLKTLNDLVAKNDQGAYMLTERGKAAAELLEKLPSQLAVSRSLKTFDAILIGLLGLALTLLPTSYTVIFGGALNVPSIPFVVPILIFLYPLFVPSYVMWRMTIKRTSSHDLYELMKPPVTAVGIFYIAVLLILLIPRLLAQPSTSTQTGTEILFVFTFLFAFLLPIFPLLGVLLFEGLYRFRSR